MSKTTSGTAMAAMQMKCPKCHKGKLFLTSNPFNIKRVHEMPERCQECGQSFEPEPGFYTGAMYVNYGFTVILTGLMFLVMEVLLKVSAYIFFGVYLGVLLLIGPFMFRYSRVVYLYLFVRYDEEAIQKHKLSDKRI
jgi:uncharacterized protein (DUF983 family)